MNQSMNKSYPKQTSIFQWPLMMLVIIVFLIVYYILLYFFRLFLPNTFSNPDVLEYFEFTMSYLSIATLIVFYVMRFLLSRKKSLLDREVVIPSAFLKVEQLSPEAMQRAASLKPAYLGESLSIEEPMIEPVVEEAPMMPEPTPEPIVAQEAVQIDDTPNTVVELKEATFIETAKAFDAYMTGHGYQGELGKSLMAMMVFTKAIVLPNLDNQSDLMNVIPAFFDGYTIVMDAVNGMYQSQASIMEQPSFESLLKSAISMPQQPHWIQIRNVNPQQLDSMLGKLKEYIQFPRHQQTVTFGQETYTIPGNIWFLIQFQKDQSIYQLKSNLLPYLGQLHIDLEKKDVDLTLKLRKTYKMDFLKASRILGPTSNSQQLPEDLWKKVDQWTSLMASINQFSVPNEISFRFENYLITYLSIEADPLKALDFGLASSLLIHAISRSKPSVYQNQQDLDHFFTSTFGRNTMKASLKVIKFYQQHTEA
jgi:hypothetical protein